MTVMMRGLTAILFAVLLSGCAGSPPRQGTSTFSASRPRPYTYVVSGPVGFVVLPPPPQSIGVANLQYEAAEKAEATAKNYAASASKEALGSAASLPLLPLVFLGGPFIGIGSAPIGLAKESYRDQQEAERMWKNAERMRGESACTALVTAAYPGLVDKLQRGLAVNSLLPEIQVQARDSLLRRNLTSSELLETPRGEDTPAEPSLAEAAHRGLANLLEIDINDIRLTGQSVISRSSDCTYEIVISTNIRLWNVKVKGVAFADFSTLYDEKLLVSKEDLLTLADQPDRLRARVAKWIGGFAFAALGSPQLKFSDAESSP